ASTAAGGAAGGAAAGAGAAGVMALLPGGVMGAPKRAGWIGVGLTVADLVMKEISDHVKEQSPNLRDAFEGAANLSFGERLKQPPPFGLFSQTGDPKAGKAGLAILDQLSGKHVQL